MNDAASPFGVGNKVLTGTTASGAGGAVQVTFTVPAGEAWAVNFGIGYHDDAARACNWAITRRGVTQLMHAGVSLGANEPTYFYSGYATVVRDAVWQGRVQLRGGDTAQYMVAAMAAAKNATAFMNVDYISGCETEC